MSEKIDPKFNPKSWTETKAWIINVDTAHPRFVYESFQHTGDARLYIKYSRTSYKKFIKLWDETKELMWQAVIKIFPKEVSTEFPEKIIQV